MTPKTSKRPIPLLRALGWMIALAACASRAATAGWKSDWSDEFNGTVVDAGVWGFDTPCCRNNEEQYYSNRTENSRLDNGTLLIQALRENFQGKAYTSASRVTRGKKSFRYGRFEIRCKVDIRNGSWPAWWWLPNSGGWPRGGEIDMMEFYQGKAHFNVMDGNQKWTALSRTVASLGGSRWGEDFHVWTMVWDSVKIQLSLDGALINDFPLENADGTGPNGGNPFRQPGYMLLNQAIGGNQGGDPSQTAFPVNMRVDWIRVHQWTEGPSRTVSVTGGTGTGVYAEGTPASITANQAPIGQVFDKWVFVSGTAAIDNPGSPTALLTVPSADVAVRAAYRAGSIGIRPPPPVPVASAGRLVAFDIRGRRSLRWLDAPEMDPKAPREWEIHFPAGK